MKSIASPKPLQGVLERLHNMYTKVSGGDHKKGMPVTIMCDSPRLVAMLTMSE